MSYAYEQSAPRTSSTAAYATPSLDASRAAATVGDRLPVVEFEQRTEGEALRLRRALADLRSSLESADKEVIVLLEEWQEALDDCDSCEAHIAKLQDRIRYQEIRLRELREVAASCFRKVSLRMTGAAQEVHIQSAPFVTIEHQQALQLQCWLLEGRSRWREVRVALSGGQLIYTRLTRSAFTRRKRHVQVAVDLAWIDGASADGDVLVGTSCCGVEPRWQWSIRLSAAGRDQLKRDVLVFCCETEAGMGFWANEINALKGRPPAPAAAARPAPRSAAADASLPTPTAFIDSLLGGGDNGLGLYRARSAPPPLNSPMAVAPASRSRFNRLDVRGEAPDKDARLPIDTADVEPLPLGAERAYGGLPPTTPVAGAGLRRGDVGDLDARVAARPPAADDLPTGGGMRVLDATPSSGRPAFPPSAGAARRSAPDLPLPPGGGMPRSPGSAGRVGMPPPPLAGLPSAGRGRGGRGSGPPRSPGASPNSSFRGSGSFRGPPGTPGGGRGMARGGGAPSRPFRASPPS